MAKKTEYLHMRIDEDLKKEAKAKAKAEGKSLSAQVRWLLTWWIGKNKRRND